ncbi:MAG: YmdB family metallophosphoesterase [Clostridiales bacterium]|nr:YmdB family metallophosphoesterase [Clostridiales bacterium]
MNILCVGDVVGASGCDHLRRVLPETKRRYQVDVCVVNGENAAEGNGLLPAAAAHIFDSGADVITTGNHVFRRRELYETLEQEPMLLRPANYPPAAPGRGWCTVDRGRYQVTVINLLGVTYMEPMDDPFRALDRLLKEAEQPRFCLVDFHAEATAEKKALACYADGRVSALYGTHTHVQTADEQVLPNGTGFLTDVGMTGPVHSVLGIRPELAVAKMKDRLPVRFLNASGPCMMNAVLFTLDDTTGKTTAVERLDIR